MAKGGKPHRLSCKAVGRAATGHEPKCKKCNQRRTAQCLYVNEGNVLSSRAIPPWEIAGLQLNDKSLYRGEGETAALRESDGSKRQERKTTPVSSLHVLSF